MAQAGSSTGTISGSKGTDAASTPATPAARTADRRRSPEAAIDAQYVYFVDDYSQITKVAK